MYFLEISSDKVLLYLEETPQVVTKDCVLGPVVTPSDCTANCGVLTQNIISPKQGSGTCDPVQYVCKPGDGACPPANINPGTNYMIIHAIGNRYKSSNLPLYQREWPLY